MTRTPRVLLIVAPILALTLSGCDDELAFYIYQNQVPLSGCVVPAEEQQVYISEGLLDVSLGQGYTLFPLLRNDLPPRKQAGSPSDWIEPNALHLREFRVELDLAGVPQEIPAELKRFSHPTSGVLLPGGRRSASVKVIPDGLAKALQVPADARPMIVATITAVAENGTGELIESLPFYYPITLCQRCLIVTYSSCSAIETLPTGQSNVCGTPQDSPLVCCKDESLGFRCLRSEQPE